MTGSSSRIRGRSGRRRLTDFRKTLDVVPAVDLRADTGLRSPSDEVAMTENEEKPSKLSEWMAWALSVAAAMDPSEARLLPTKPDSADSSAE
jgi:hypothetical protein